MDCNCGLTIIALTACPGGSGVQPFTCLWQLLLGYPGTFVMLVIVFASLLVFVFFGSMGLEKARTLRAWLF